MKKLLSYLIIIFFSSLTFSFSEDISDFQIEGISVGDSVYDYFTEGTLSKKEKPIKTRSAKKFNGSGTYSESYGEAEASGNINETSIPNKNLELYDDVTVAYFSDTNIIKNITGIKYFKKKNCNGKQKEAFNDLNKILEGNYKMDKKAVAEDIHLIEFTFDFENGGSIKIGCYDKDKKKNNAKWVSVLMMTINSKGIKKTPEEDTTPSSGEKNKTKNEFIQIKPTQPDIGDKIKF